MAKYLNMAIGQAMFRCVAVGAVCVVHQMANGQGLPDPTRPPALAAQSAAVPSPTGGPVLQSVLISSQRVEAIISGKTLRVGDKLGSARVARITESEVILRDGKDSQVLKLFPNIEKKQKHAASSPRALVGDNRQQ